MLLQEDVAPIRNEILMMQASLRYRYLLSFTPNSIFNIGGAECRVRNAELVEHVEYTLYTVCGILLHWENPSAYWVNQSIWHDRMGIKISNNGGWVTIETHRQNLVENTKT